MSEYRTGNHWGVTIVREGEQGSLFGLDAGPPAEHGGICNWPVETCKGHADGDRGDDQLVAVVVNGDRQLAERICRLLNGELCKHTGHHWCGGLYRDHAEERRNFAADVIRHEDECQGL